MDLNLDLEEGVIEARADFDSFFRGQFERVARAAALVTGDPGAGQDHAQEAFARLFERWNAMESDDHARNFAYKVAINLARSHLRKHRRVFLYGLQRSVEPASPDPMTRSDAWLDVVGALGTLSPRQRACVVLVDYADMDSASAGRVLGIAPSTVRVQLMRGRRALREGLGLVDEEELR